MNERKRAARLEERRRLRNDRDAAEREFRRLVKRRDELAARHVLNEDRRTRFLVRINANIDAAHRKLQEAEMALEGAGAADPESAEQELEQ